MSDIYFLEKLKGNDVEYNEKFKTIYSYLFRIDTTTRNYYIKTCRVYQLCLILLHLRYHQ